MQVITPPNDLPYGSPEYTVFLAGSIEMGAAVDWQKELINQLADLPGIILNPRRSDWDSSWEQKIDNPQFNQQVTWELDALDMAEKIFMYFDPNTKSPISLLELGLHAESKRLVVCCPEGFWRKGNVDIVCKRYEIETVNSLTEFKNICEFDLQISDTIDEFYKSVETLDEFYKLMEDEHETNGLKPSTGDRKLLQESSELSEQQEP